MSFCLFVAVCLVVLSLGLFVCFYFFVFLFCVFLSVVFSLIVSFLPFAIFVVCLFLFLACVVLLFARTNEIPSLRFPQAKKKHPNFLSRLLGFITNFLALSRCKIDGFWNRWLLNFRENLVDGSTRRRVDASTRRRVNVWLRQRVMVSTRRGVDACRVVDASTR